VFSPDDGHIFARKMYIKAINVLRKTVQQVGSIYEKNIRYVYEIHNMKEGIT